MSLTPVTYRWIDTMPINKCLPIFLSIATLLDTHLNGRKDAGESRGYFEFSDYSTSYVYFEQPK